jgi:hypothetical protein
LLAVDLRATERTDPRSEIAGYRQMKGEREVKLESA